MVIFERGYCRYWVARACKGMVHEVVKTLPLPEDGHVLTEPVIRLTSRKALQAELPNILRIECRNSEIGKVYIFLTNQRRWAAHIVADIYKKTILTRFIYLRQGVIWEGVMECDLWQMCSRGEFPSTDNAMSLCNVLTVRHERPVMASRAGVA